MNENVKKLSAYLVAKHEHFVPFAFNLLKGAEYIATPFDRIINETLDKTFTGEIKRLIINIPPRHGKCITENTLITTPRGYVKMKHVKLGDSILGFENGVCTERKVINIEKHVKPIVKITCKSKRTLEVSHDHPLLTDSGWKKAEDLKPTDFLIRLCTELEGGTAVDENELIFVMMLLFEGSVSNAKTGMIGFTSSQPKVVATFKKACANLGIDVKYRNDKDRPYDYSVLGGVNGKAKALCDKYGLTGKLSKTKVIPDEFMTLPLSQRYLLLGVMFATDGWVTSVSHNKDIGYSSTSIEMRNQIGLILDSCGIPSIYRSRMPNIKSGMIAGNKVNKEGINEIHELRVSLIFAKKLKGKIDVLDKQPQFDEMMTCSEASSTSFGYPPRLFKGLTYKCKNLRPRIKTSAGSGIITEYTFDRLIKEVKPELEKYRHKDFIYDKVKSIEHVEKGLVYHFGVDRENYDDQNYLANNYVVHNTLRAVQAYVARGFALNNKANFIHASYSDKLVQDNSVAIRDIIKHKDYQTLFPHVNFKQDTQAKGLWKTTAGGTFLASPSGGAITGFGAGIIGAKEFSGCLIVDDPVKPDDAYSDAILTGINSRWEGTFKSRLADQNVPVIVIMQRISENDFTSELLERSGSDEEWHHLVLPAYIDSNYEYTQSGHYIEHNLPDGALWPVKFSDTQAKAAMSNIQWSQESTPAKGEVYEREWFNRYTSLPSNIKNYSIYCDTASKTNKYNDYSVFQLWAKTTSNQGYLVKQWRKKVKVPFLNKNFCKFYIECAELVNPKDMEKLKGSLVWKNIEHNEERHKQRAILVHNKIFKVKPNIEDKDSGVGLIQSLEVDGFRVTAITRKQGKYARAVAATPNVLHGNIFIPTGAMGDGLITEAVKFKADDSHAHDDQIDPMNDFINYELPKVGAVAVGRMAGGY